MISLLFAVTLPFYPPGQHLGGYGMRCDANGVLTYEYGGKPISAAEFEANVPGTAARKPICASTDEDNHTDLGVIYREKYRARFDR